MKKLFLFLMVVAAAVSAQTSVSAGKDTVIAEKQVTQAAYVLRPSFRYVTDAFVLNDSLTVDIRVNKTVVKSFRYKATQAPLDVNNATKAVVQIYVDDFSK